MNISNILVIPKKSTIERDGLTSLSEKKLLEKKYKEEDYDSHLRQKQFIEELKKKKIKNFLTLDDLTIEEVNKYKAALTASGDDFFCQAAHYIIDIPVIPFNSDYKLSHGNLLPYTIHDLERVLINLENDNYSIEEWARAKITINDKEIKLTTSLALIRNIDISLRAHYDLYLDGHIKQASSGLLIVTGAGSTNPWYSFYRRVFNLKPFGKEEKKLAFVAREYSGEMPYGEINEGQELKIVYGKHSGELSVDSFDKHTYDIKRGDEIKVSISDKPLRIIKV